MTRVWNWIFCRFPRNVYGTVLGFGYMTTAVVGLLQYPLILWSTSGHFAVRKNKIILGVKGVLQYISVVICILLYMNIMICIHFNLSYIITFIELFSNIGKLIWLYYNIVPFSTLIMVFRKKQNNIGYILIKYLWHFSWLQCYLPLQDKLIQNITCNINLYIFQITYITQRKTSLPILANCLIQFNQCKVLSYNKSELR